MELKTAYHGKLNYKEEDIITFKKGIPGFEDLKKFIIADINGNDNFKIFHSIEDANIGFVVTVPFLFYKDYEVNIHDDMISSLDIKKENEVLILSTVTLGNTLKETTINLKAPFVINMRNKLGEQYIDQKDKYNIKSPLIKE